MRPLTQRQSVACETAVTTRCTCRCAGAFHGANRQASSEVLAYVIQLAEDDPHYVRNKTYQLRLPVPVGSAA